MSALSPQHSDVAHATRAAPQSTSAPLCSSSTGVAASDAVVADDEPLAPPPPPPPPPPAGRAVDAVVTADTERAPSAPASARNADDRPAAPAHVTRGCDDCDDCEAWDVWDVWDEDAGDASGWGGAALGMRVGDGDASRRRPTRCDTVRRRSGHGLSGGGRFRPVRAAGASRLPSLIPQTTKTAMPTHKTHIPIFFS